MTQQQQQHMPALGLATHRPPSDKEPTSGANGAGNRPFAPWDTDRMLEVYIHDYCRKRGFLGAAQAFASEARVSPDQQPPIDSGEGFLYEWWTVFWDVFYARSSKWGTKEAQAYMEFHHARQVQMKRAAQQAQQLHLQQQQQAQQAQQPRQQEDVVQGSAANGWTQGNITGTISEQHYRMQSGSAATGAPSPSPSQLTSPSLMSSSGLPKGINPSNNSNNNGITVYPNTGNHARYPSAQSPAIGSVPTSLPPQLQQQQQQMSQQQQHSMMALSGTQQQQMQQQYAQQQHSQQPGTPVQSSSTVNPPHHSPEAIAFMTAKQQLGIQNKPLEEMTPLERKEISVQMNRILMAQQAQQHAQHMQLQQQEQAQQQAQAQQQLRPQDAALAQQQQQHQQQLAAFQQHQLIEQQKRHHQQQQELQNHMQAIQQRASMAQESMSAMSGTGSDVTEDHLAKRARQQQHQHQVEGRTKQSPLMTAQQVQQANANMWQTAIANMTPQQQLVFMQRQQQMLQEKNRQLRPGAPQQQQQAQQQQPGSGMTPEAFRLQQEQLKNKQIQQQHLMMAQKQATAAAANAAANANMQSSPRLQPSALQIQQQQHQHVTNANKRKLGQSESGQNGNQAYYNPRPEFNNPHQLQQLSVNTSMNPSQLPPTRPSTLSPDPTNGMTPPPPPQAQIDLIQESPPPQQSFASPPQPILQSMVADPSSTLHFEEIEKLLLATTQDMDVGDWLAEHQGDQAPVSANEVEKQVGDDIKDGGMSESDLFGVDPASEPDQGLTSTAFPSDQTLLTPNPSSPPDSPSLEIEPLTTLKGHVGKVTACAFDKESQVLASVGIDKQLIFWDLSSMSESSPEDGVKPMLNIERHSTKNISAIRFLKATHLYGESTEECVDSLSSGPALLATCGYDKVVQVTKLSSASSSSAMEAVSMTSFGGHQRSVTSVDFCPLAFSAPHKDWKVDYLVSSLDLEGDLFIWNAWTGDQLLSLKMSPSGMHDVSSNPLRFRPIQHNNTSQLVLVVGFGKSLSYIHFQVSLSETGSPSLTETITTLITPHQKNISSLDWSKNGRWLISSSEDMVDLWDTAPVKSGSKDPLHFVAKIPSQNGKISSCIFLESKKRVSVDGVESEREEDGDSVPPRIVLGEYQSMHIWQITASASSSFAQSNVSRILSLPSCQEGVVCCLDASIGSHTNEEDPCLVLSSASGSQENNLKLWKIRS